MKRNKRTSKTHKNKPLIIKAKKLKKVNSLNNSNQPNKLDNINHLKHRIFNISLNDIREKIVFLKDIHQPNNYPNMVNYRCKNQRKNEHILETNFCNSLIKKKQGK